MTNTKFCINAFFSCNCKFIESILTILNKIIPHLLETHRPTGRNMLTFWLTTNTKPSSFTHQTVNNVLQPVHCMTLKLPHLFCLSMASALHPLFHDHHHNDQKHLWTGRERKMLASLPKNMEDMAMPTVRKKV